eukprot:TRINITY_DN3552_c0_g1_i1.p1 TRINITY_DN3552_c0_g1~~TRINITY_DN3552_c0_g1_i1.p1  ORF type:complete len:298 (+),score=60.34 TRINITY_DN3552_c0_g1_i1:436-1329(+)
MVGQFKSKLSHCTLHIRFGKSGVFDVSGALGTVQTTVEKDSISWPLLDTLDGYLSKVGCHGVQSEAAVPMLGSSGRLASQNGNGSSSMIAGPQMYLGSLHCAGKVSGHPAHRSGLPAAIRPSSLRCNYAGIYPYINEPVVTQPIMKGYSALPFVPFVLQPSPVPRVMSYQFCASILPSSAPIGQAAAPTSSAIFITAPPFNWGDQSTAASLTTAPSSFSWGDQTTAAPLTTAPSSFNWRDHATAASLLTTSSSFNQSTAAPLTTAPISFNWGDQSSVATSTSQQPTSSCVDTFTAKQ